MSEVEELLQKDSKAIMRSIIQRIATGPDMSKDISQEEARSGMRSVLDLSLIHISEPTRLDLASRMPSSA